MRLRAKIVLSFLPLVAALVLVGYLAAVSLSATGRHADHLFETNYRSVLSAQRITEAAERIESATLLEVAGGGDRSAEAEGSRALVEEELRVQEGNCTEPGEREATARLVEAWNRFSGLHRRFLDEPAARTPTFLTASLEPAFLRLREEAARVLAINHEAMAQKNRSVLAYAERTRLTVLGVALAATVAGILASVLLVRRILRPLKSLRRAVDRLAAGDLAARARVEGQDELARLAVGFNHMAEGLEEVRRSSLGELLLAQSASQSAIESIPDPVLVFSDAGKLIAHNEAARTLYAGPGCDDDPSAELAAPIRAVVARVRDHVLSGKGPYVPRGFEEAVLLPGAETDRWFLPRATPVRAGRGALAGATVIVQDVTRLRRFDELKNDLVATAAHELRTPLTSLRMAVHLCATGVAGPVTDRMAEVLLAARSDCERLQGMVDDMLDLARLQGGGLALQLEPVPVDELLARCLRSHAGAAGARDVRLVAPPVPAASVEVDRSRLELVLDNLIANAIRYSPEGGAVTLRCRTDGRYARFEVEDAGPGIAREHQRAVFERFFRVPGAPRGGAGLGLSIAQEIVRAHGGEIGVDSAPGKGSRFWFTVPAARERG